MQQHRLLQNKRTEQETKSEAQGQKTCPWVRRIQVSTSDVRKEVSPLAKIKIKKRDKDKEYGKKQIT
jgi:hypothetical protein